MPVVVANHYEFRIKAEAENQSVQNTFHYRAQAAAAGLVTLEDLAIAFQDLWDGTVCPLLHTSYKVVAYEVLHVSGAQFLPYTGPPIPPAPPVVNGPTRLAYDELHTEPPTALSHGGKATDSSPTFVALGIRKSCGVVRDPDGTFQVNGGLLSGSMRLGPIVEADTSATNPNELEPAALAAAGAIEAALASFGADAGNALMVMEVISLIRGGLYRLTGGGLPTFATADVLGLLVNKMITSQVSRKARLRYG